MIGKICVLTIFAVFQVVENYKICLFACDISASQVIFTKRVAETLAKAGHDVTMYRIKALEYQNVKVAVDPAVKVVDVEAHAKVDHRVSSLYEDPQLLSWSSHDAYSQLSSVFVASCAELVKNKQFRSELKNEKYDLAFAHPYDYCSAGLIHDAQIPTWIWLNTGKLHDMIAHDVGLPSPPSFVPVVMADSSDKMDFWQRLTNFIARAAVPVVLPKMIVDQETALFRQHIDPSFPDLRDLARNCPLVMVNSHELYDLPQPILSKIIYIAGLGMNQEKHKDIPKDYLSMLDNYESAAIFSMGTVANSSQMPNVWKEGLVKSFAKFNNTLFFLRYEAEDLNLTSNVFISKWLPQSSLLRHPKVKFFITHGGYNSLQEAVYSAKPLVMIPLFGDQKRNAHMAENLGFAIRIRKSAVNEDSLTAAIDEMLNRPFKKRAVDKIHEMVMKRPFSAEETLVKWTEFLAEFKDLSHLNPASIGLNFVEYHNIDVIGFLLGCSMVIFGVFAKLILLFYKIARPHVPLFIRIVVKMTLDFKTHVFPPEKSLKIQ